MIGPCIPAEYSLLRSINGQSLNGGGQASGPRRRCTRSVLCAEQRRSRAHSVGMHRDHTHRANAGQAQHNGRSSILRALQHQDRATTHVE
jgi:hypothetical protein